MPLVRAVSTSSTGRNEFVRVDPEELNLKDKLVSINRVAKVVKGGKRFSFSALVVVGDGEGWVGIGKGKATEVPPAIAKAVGRAKKQLIRVPLKNRSIPHDVHGFFCGEHVLMKPAKEGTGIIAGGPIRAACEVLGIRDVVAKSLGSSNPINVLKACIKGFKNQNSPKFLANARGKKIAEITKKN